MTDIETQIEALVYEADVQRSNADRMEEDHPAWAKSMKEAADKLDEEANRLSIEAGLGSIFSD